MKDYIGFVYIWTNKMNGKAYIGAHRGKADDGYIGSGVYFRRAIERYGLDNFDRQILYYEFDSFERLFQKEFEIINEYNAVKSRMFYNLTNYTPRWSSFLNGGRTRTHTDETKARLSSARKGKPLSDQHRQSLSASNHARGRSYYNNGTTEGRFTPTEVPAGWRKGRLSGRVPGSGKGTVFIHDANGNEKRWPENKALPEGWHRGKPSSSLAGEENSFYGKKHTAETKKQISTTKRRKKT